MGPSGLLRARRARLGAAGRPSSATLCPSLFGPNAPPEPLSGARSPPHTRVLYWHQKYGSMSQAWHGSQIRCLIDTVRTVSMRQRNTILAPRREDQLVHLIGCTVLDLLGRIGHERGHADDRRRDHDAGDKDDHVQLVRARQLARRSAPRRSACRRQLSSLLHAREGREYERARAGAREDRQEERGGRCGRHELGAS